MAAKTTKRTTGGKRKKTATAPKVARGKTEAVKVPRSAVELAAAISKRMERSPRYWEQLQAAMQAAQAGIPWRAAQVEPRDAPH